MTDQARKVKTEKSNIIFPTQHLIGLITFKIMTVSKSLHIIFFLRRVFSNFPRKYTCNKAWIKVRSINYSKLKLRLSGLTNSKQIFLIYKSCSNTHSFFFPLYILGSSWLYY